MAGRSFLPQGVPLTFVAHADGGADFVDGQVVVKIRTGVDILPLLRRLDLRILENLNINIFLLGLPLGMTVNQALTLLRLDPSVEWVEPNFLFQSPEVKQRSVAHVDGSPSSYQNQYAMALVRAPQAQAIASGKGQTVAVIDTGIDMTHPVFTDLADGYDYVDNDPDPSEVSPSALAFGHGTMVAGVIALIAPDATIMPIRAFDSSGAGKETDVYKAIQLARGARVDVINMSFSLSVDSTLIRSAVSAAAQEGVTMVAASGNENTSSPQYPAAYNSWVSAVSATDSGDYKAGFSNYGSHIDECAPGVGVYSAYPGGQYAWADGTSFSAPFVSAGAALVLSAGLSVDRIRSTAVNIDGRNRGYRGQLGSGRIDLMAAVRR